MSLITDHILTWVTFVPLIGSLLLWTVVRRDQHARILALVVALADFVLSLHLWFRFDSGRGDDQFVERVAWLWSGQVSYHFGCDGISLVLAVLTTFLGPLILLSTWKAVTDRVRDYMAFLLMLQAAMLGTFFARDMLLFYVFWEAMLIPMYFIIGIWGGQRRIYAAVKFFIFTMVGSVFMLVGILYLFFQAGSMNLTDFLNVHLGRTEQLWLFAAFFLAFAIKVPVFPLHTWLPDAHVEAPTAGSVVLAGVLLKMGTYGILRISYPILPDAALWFAFPLAILGAINILYGAYCAMAQSDMKKLVAYSSVSHMGYVLLGMAAFTEAGINGAVLQMFNHGTITAMMFLCVGVVYDRAHTREINGFGGLMTQMPVYGTVFSFALFAALGLPGLSGFVSEAMIFMGVFPVYRTVAMVSALGIIIGAAYVLWMLQRVFLGPKNEKWDSLPDINAREMFTLVPIGVIVLLLGVYPMPVLNLMKVSLNNLIKVVAG
ncbi:MAG: NADH-quinone oxidoreductase subunit M [bacterium]